MFVSSTVRYSSAAALSSTASCCRRAVGAEAAQREFRATPDWAESAINGDHLWSPTTQSGDMCYVGEPECTVSSTLRSL